jgi:hypothetical protein
MQRVCAACTQSSVEETALATTPGSPDPVSTLREAIRPIYDRWMEAVRDKNMSTLESIMATEYIYTATGQGRSTRRQWMDSVPVYDIISYELMDFDVLPLGDSAVCAVRYRQEARVRGVPRSGEFLITDTWVRRDGRWQVVSRSSILMA